MKFKSKKDIVFQILTFGLSSFFAAIILYQVVMQKSTNQLIVNGVIMIVTIGFLLWIYFGTEYEVTKSELKYKSGPIKGKIQIEEITEIIKNKTLWSGLKPATARNGLIVKYRKFEEIYISPKTNDAFVNEILEINKNIKVT
jgi:hypothetical protein